MARGGRVVDDSVGGSVCVSEMMWRERGLLLEQRRHGALRFLILSRVTEE